MRIFYLFLIVSLHTFFAFGQHEDFLDEEIWYCTKVVLNGEEVDYESLSVDNEYYYGPVIKNWPSDFDDEVYSDIEFCDEACSSEIYLIDEGELQIGPIYCLASESTFNLNYFCHIFRDFWEEIHDTTVTYEITEEEAYKELKITDLDGNQTFYRNVAPLSVESSEFSDLTIYPNPVKNELYFENLKTTASVRIYDLTGAELFQKNISEGQAQLELGFLSEGIYFYELKSDKAVKTGKLIKI